MFTTMASGMGAPTAAAVSAEVMVEYMATEELAGVAIEKVINVPHVMEHGV